MASIIPAILAKNFEDLVYTYNRIHSFAPLIHIDVADGEFVPDKTAGPEALRSLNSNVPLEIHLMVKNPLDWIQWFHLPVVKRILFHFESFDATEEIIYGLRAQNCEPGLVLNPQTTIEQIKMWVEKVEVIQLMTVQPGKQGNPLLPQVLDKVDYFKKKFPDLPVAVDGGISIETIAQVLHHPVDRLVVGSAIVKAHQPQDSYDRLVAIAAK